MRIPVKATVVTVAVTLVLLIAAGIWILIDGDGRSESAPTGAVPQLQRPESHLLDDAGPDAVTIVEFLDFECEACGAFYPVVEELREKHAGEITYVVRYFPLPGHANSTNAALSVEAAAAQGRFADMYHRMFETQAEWGEAQDSRAGVFRDFAADLGLDLDAYDTAVADPATLRRVQADFAEGRDLGIGSTPTFFVDGEYIPMEGWNSLDDAVDRALEGRG